MTQRPSAQGQGQGRRSKIPPQSPQRKTLIGHNYTSGSEVCM